MKRMHRCILAMTLLLATGCSTIDDLTSWMGSEDEKTPLPGKRMPVLSDLSHLTVDPSIASLAVTVPDAQPNESWSEAGGGPAGITGNLASSGFTHHDSVKIGEHNGWEQALYAGPVIAGNIVYAIDAKGYVSAHSTADINKILWSNKSAVTDDEADLLGGGLAVSNGRLYVSSGRGKIFALDAASGKELWKQTLGVSLRAAPKANGDKVYALSVDNQLFAFDAEKGTPLWSHRGANESAGFLAAATPAITDAVALAPYSSGELHAIDTVGGLDVWNDTLLLPRRGSATGLFSGIGGNPIVKDDIVYAGSSSGFFAGIALLNGRRMWEQNIATLNTPWIAGDFIYILSSEDELTCLSRADGRVKWLQQLPRYANEERRKNPYVWRGPIMAQGQLLVAGAHGTMLALSPKDGSTIAKIDIPEKITDAPVLANGRLYFLTQDAKLHVLY